SDFDLALVVLRKQKEYKSAASTLRQFSKVNKKSNRTKCNLRAKIPKELCKEEMSKEDELNQIREIIEDAITKVEKKVLPSKDIKNELGKQNSRSNEYRDLKAIKLLSILISTIRKNRDSRSVADWRKWKID
ncbi:38981_t:CDS:2, partial [Gigaspora margarita]